MKRRAGQRTLAWNARDRRQLSGQFRHVGGAHPDGRTRLFFPSLDVHAYDEQP
jgi:hypothetical protein